MKSFRIIAIIVAQLLALSGKAQTRAYNHYGVAEGLPGSTVYCALQDSKGFMWFGTESGVSRFDGRIFKNYSIRDGLSDNEVFRMFEDNENRIWFLTFNGHLTYYKDNKFYNEKTDSLLAIAFIEFIFTEYFLTNDNTIYLTGSKNLQVRINGDKITKIKVPNASSNGNSKIYSDGKREMLFDGNDLMIISDSGLYSIGKYPYNNARFLNSISNNNNHFFFCSDNGIHKFADNKAELIIPRSDFNLPILNGIMNVTETADNDLWVGEWSSGLHLYRQDKHNGIYHLISHFLPGKTVLSVSKDKEGNTWFTTEGDGVYMITKNNYEVINYNNEAGLISEQVYVIRMDTDSSIWLGCNNNQLTRIKNDSITHFSLDKEKVNSYHVYDFIFANDYIFCGTSTCMYRLDRSGNSIIVPFIDLNTNIAYKYSSVKSLNKRKDGSVTVTLSNGHYNLNTANDGNEYLATKVNQHDHELRTYTHFHDRSDRTWISNIKGLAWLDNNRYHYMEDTSALLKKRLHKISESSEGLLLLVSAGNGIILFNKSKVVGNITQNDGLVSDNCNSIFIKKDTMWIATNAGITCGTIKSNKFKWLRNYTTRDGLLSNDIKDILVVNNIIYAGSNKGLSCIPINEMFSKALPPPIYFIDESNDEIFVNNRTITLPYDSNFINVKFTAPAYATPSEVFYEYRLNNNAPSITTTGNIEFAELEPDKYQLKVRAKKTNSEWSNPITLNFEVLPPFWKTPWFIFLELMVLTLLLIYVIKFYFKRKLTFMEKELEKENLINTERLRISSDIHDDLGTQLSQIAIISEILKKDNHLHEQGHKQINKISEMSHELISKMGEIIWALNTSNDNLKNLLAYLQEYILETCEVSNMEADINFPKPYPDYTISAGLRRNIFLVLKECLSNTLKHAGATCIYIECTKYNGWLLFSYFDNGKGYNAEELHTGNGLKNIRNRMKEINGEVRFENVNGITQILLHLKLN